MQAVLAPHDAIDLLHMDVQGSEFPLILSALHVLARKVRYLYIGTHSRPIEGELINLLFRRGWQLEREDPCYFRCGQDGPTLEALTLRDGGQVWRNTALAD